MNVELTEGTQVILNGGVKPGDQIVVDGQEKLKNGSKVFPRTAPVKTGDGTTAEVDAVGDGGAAVMSSSMSPSRPFILRPVATSLLMVAILLAGFVAYVQLPVSALPQVDYPTIQVQTFYPGASPEVMASSVTAPLERQFGQIPGLSQMTSTSSGGGSVITLQFSLDGVDRRGAAGCAGGDQCGVQLSAEGPAESAGVQQGESGGCADHDAGADERYAAAVERWRTLRTR